MFNNGSNPGKGKSQYTLKVRVYSSEPVNQRKPDWERVIQLIDPKKVVGWAHKEHSAGKLSDHVLERYSEVARSCSDWACDSGTDWAKMGNISSKPGTIYFPDQFVSMRFLINGHATATLHIDGQIIEFETFHLNTRSTRSHSPTHHALYDPTGLIDMRRP